MIFPPFLQAFEHLIQLEFVSPVSGGPDSTNHHLGGGRRTMKEYRLMVLRVLSDQVREAVKNYPNCPTDLSRWGLSLSMRN